MIISEILKIIYFILLTFVVIYFFITSRKKGCKDPKYVNYNPDVNIHDPTMCIPKVKGCMDKNANNYNKYANIICEEDCIGCELKGTCELCKKQEKCIEDCKHCICTYNKSGCNRDWALNYDPNITGDNNSCISKEEILRNISVISGGNNLNCSNRVLIRVKDKYPILGGNYGLNVVVINRTIDMEIRYIKNFNTGRYEEDSIKFVNFMKRYIHSTDIVIIAVRGDAVGKKKKEYDRMDIFEERVKKCEKFRLNRKGQKIVDNSRVAKDGLEIYLCEKNMRDKETGEYVYEKGDELYLSPIISDEVKLVFKDLGSPNPMLVGNGSYILIGSYLKDIYFEDSNTFSDVSFPNITYANLRCMNMYSPLYIKYLINPKENKLLENIGSSDNLDITKIDVVKRCALEAEKLGFPLFSISNSKCFGVKYKENIEIEYPFNKKSPFYKGSDGNIPYPCHKFHWDSNCKYKNNQCICPNIPYWQNRIGYSEAEFFDENQGTSNWFDRESRNIKYLNHNKNFTPVSSKCYFTKNLDLFGNQLDECLYSIIDVGYDGKLDLNFGTFKVQAYSNILFKGVRKDFGVGFHEPLKIQNKNIKKFIDTDGYEFVRIESIKVPKDMMVSLYRFTDDDEDFTIEFTKDPFYVVYKEDIGAGIENSVSKKPNDFDAYNAFDFSNEEGVKLEVTMINYENEKYKKKYKFRTGPNLLKKIKFKRNEVKARIVLLRNKKIIFNKIFSIKFYEDIKNFKKLNLKNRIGYIETLDKNNFIINRYDFTIGSEFQRNLNIRFAILEAVEDKKQVPKVKLTGAFSIKVMLINPNFKELPLALNLIGLNNDDEQKTKGGKKLKEYENIGKEFGYTSRIKLVNVTYTRGIGMIFQGIDFGGISMKLVRGKYNLPDDFVFFIKSLYLNIANSVFRFFSEDNFEDEHFRIENNRGAGGKLNDNRMYSNLENFHEGIISKKIKSVIVEKAPLQSGSLGFNNYIENYNSAFGIEICDNDQFKDSVFLNIGYTNFDFGFDINIDPIQFNNDVNYVGSIEFNSRNNIVYFKDVEGMNNKKRNMGLNGINFIKKYNLYGFKKKKDSALHSTDSGKEIQYIISTYKNLNFGKDGETKKYFINPTKIDHNINDKIRNEIDILEQTNMYQNKLITSLREKNKKIKELKKKVNWNGKNILIKQYVFFQKPTKIVRQTINTKKGNQIIRKIVNVPTDYKYFYCIGPPPTTNESDLYKGKNGMRSIKYFQSFISEITVIFKRKHIVVKKIVIPKGRTSNFNIKGVDIYKVKKDEIMKRVIYYDKENNIIGYDSNIGNNKYIWDVVVEPIIIGSEIEYYPREQRWVIKSSTDSRLVDSCYIEYTKSDINISKNKVGKRFVEPLYKNYLIKDVNAGNFSITRDKKGYTNLVSFNDIEYKKI